MLLYLTKPDRGRILIDGENILTAEARERKNLTRKIQIIFQHPESSLDPGRQIGYSLREPMRIHRLYSPVEQENRLRYLLDLVELDEKLLDRYPHQISGGEAQRLMIARALTLDPAILVLDEPTSMLDVSIQAQILNLLMDLQERMGFTYIFITHDLSVVHHLSDSIAVMYLGECVEFGSKEQIFEAPQHPYTKSLLSAIPIPSAKERNRKVELIRGEITSAVDLPEGCRFASRCPNASAACKNKVSLHDIGGGHRISCVLQ